jgi:predicted nucleic acid-binding protein
VIVVDASALVEWLLHTPTGARVDARLRDRTLYAPHLVDLEIVQVLRRAVRLGSLTDWVAEEILRDLIDLPITRCAHDVLLARAWELRHNLTAYDAAYVALAEMLGAPLLTCDRKLASSHGHRARIDAI